jgi:hypothetical protein
MCIHIESTTLTDGTYNLVLESESEQRKAQVNLTEDAEDPNQHSEELPTRFCSRRQAPVHDPSVSIYATDVPFYLCI